MPPQFFESGSPVQHPLEGLFNASAWDILSAMARGFRAQVDVKGKLAELFLHRQLESLLQSGAITKLDWRDKDGVPDFLLHVKGTDLQMECKNVRSAKTKGKKNTCKVEIQKTRSQIGGGPKRGYRVDEFDILAACLFNQTGKWEYLFAATRDLQRRPLHPDYLVIMQQVPCTPQGHWKATVAEVISSLVGPCS
jgi:hypothetical protein